jgi:hypothetical protein
MKHIGYTSEQFRIDKGKIYKYTNDPNRIDFLRSQMNHLQQIGEKYPDSVPAKIQWEQNSHAEEWGYSMEYISDAERINESHLTKVIILIEHCSNLYPQRTVPYFGTFIDYLHSVVQKNSHLFFENDFRYLEKEYFPTLERMQDYFNEERSSCHGDFTMENILVDGTRLVMIDPIHKPGMWSSWLQDVAKFYQNIYFSDVPKTLYFTEKIDLIAAGKTTPIYKMIYLLMISNYIRMFPYIADKPEIFEKRYLEFQTLISSL